MFKDPRLLFRRPQRAGGVGMQPRCGACLPGSDPSAEAHSADRVDAEVARSGSIAQIGAGTLNQFIIDQSPCAVLVVH